MGSIPAPSAMFKMQFKFNYKEKELETEVKECKSFFAKTFGLMFRKKSPCLLFVFNKQTKIPIHSFFCKPFYAVWFNNDEIVDEKMVKGWRFSIKPKDSFDNLLEIPSGNEFFKMFADG